MYRKICHHNYRYQGLAFDDTSFENHGLSHQTTFEPNGSAAGTGAARFAASGSRIRIANNPSWQHLKALRVQMLVRLDAYSHIRANLVEGHGAFAFYIEESGILAATVFGAETLGGPKVWHGVSSTPPYSPDGLTHVVPVNQWVVVGVEHDGFANFILTIDGQVVGQRNDLVSSVPSVGGHGVNIGNWPDGDAYTLHGMIDELTIEKYDQDALTNEFTSRPLTPAEGNCWLDMIQAITAAIRSGDEQVRSAANILQWMRDQFVRQIAKQGPAIQKKNAEFAARFIDLWSKGWLGTPEMEKLLREWLCWLKTVVGVDLEALVTAMTNPGPVIVSRPPRLDLSNLIERLGTRACDTDFILFLKTLQRVLSNLKDCKGIPVRRHFP